MKTDRIDPIELHLDGILMGKDSAWNDSVCGEMVKCAENAIRLKYPNLGEGEYKELADEAICRFLKTPHKTRTDFPNACYVRAFLKTTVRRLAIDLITKKSGQPRVRGKKSDEVQWGEGKTDSTPEPNKATEDQYTGIEIESERREQVDLKTDPTKEVQYDEEKLIVHEVLSRMDERCRLLLKLFLAGLDMVAIGTKLNSSKSVVYERLNHCLEKLRKACLKMIQLEDGQLGGAT